jgi:formate dehydrogenase subunit gamma
MHWPTSRTWMSAARLSLAAAFLAVSGLASAQTLTLEPVPDASQQQAQPSAGGIQGANIFQIAPGASTDPNYMNQSNAERAQVQPGNNAPVWRQVGQGVTGTTNFPYPEYGNMIQGFVQYPGSTWTNAGEAWRQVRNNVIIPYGGSLLLIVAVAIAIFYFGKGTIQLHGQETGRKIERFTAFERAAHWTNAIAFVTLAISGLVMAFGKFFLLPIMGSSLFGWFTYILKNVHNFVGPLFAVSLVIVIFTFFKDNLPSKEDIKWILGGGGLLSGKEIPSHRFNAGEKFVFWGGVFFLGLIVVASGLVLDMLIPGLAYLRADMQIAHMIHASAAVIMMVLFMGHIYMGTLGMSGAYQAMKTGYVDETWAKEHHELWYDDIKAGKIPAERSAKGGAPEASTVSA